MAKVPVTAIAPCRPHLRRFRFLGVTVAMDERCMPSLARIDRRYHELKGAARYPVRQRDTGAYNCRKTTSGRSWSKHAYGVAIDINWTSNPYGRRLVTDMPTWFRQLFLDEGWGWGGNWRSVKDAMHFSKFPNEGGDGWLDDAPPAAPATTTTGGAELDANELKILKATAADAEEARVVAHNAKNAAEAVLEVVNAIATELRELAESQTAERAADTWLGQQIVNLGGVLKSLDNRLKKLEAAK